MSDRKHRVIMRDATYMADEPPHARNLPVPGDVRIPGAVGQQESSCSRWTRNKGQILLCLIESFWLSLGRGGFILSSLTAALPLPLLIFFFVFFLPSFFFFSCRPPPPLLNLHSCAIVH